MLTAIGFIAGGAVFKGPSAVHGTAIAASLRPTGVIGAAVSYGLYDIAAVLSVITYLILRLLSPLKAEVEAEAAAHGRDMAPPHPGGVSSAPGRPEANG